MDEREKQEKRMVNRAYFTCAAIVIAGCLVLGFFVALLAGFRFSADSAAGGAWNKAESLELGSYTFYYTPSRESTGHFDRFVAVKKSSLFYYQSRQGGKLVYPTNSDVPAGQLFSYEDGKQWHHVLLLNMVLPQGTDRQIDKLVVRGVEIQVQHNSCFSTTYNFSEFILDGVTFEVRTK